MFASDDIEDDNNTVFRDVLTLALSGLMTMVIMVVPHINPKGRTSEGEINAPGNVVVEARWPDGVDSDVDLWVQAPGDHPVGYSNKSGAVFNLLRDDLGLRGGPAERLNYEVSYSRGVPAGEYTVNLHLYRNPRRSGEPIPVDVSVGVKPTPKDSIKRLMVTTVVLRRVGEERTAVRFRLDQEGRLVPDSIHNIERHLLARNITAG